MPRRLVVIAIALMVVAPFRAARAGFATFESGPVRPLAQSPDGTRLFACNAPDNTLEILSIGAGGSLTPAGAVTVGLEPVAVAARSDTEVWVVNHLSDSVSVVDVTPGQPARVVRTLLVGDEPRDIVFAGPGHIRAFVTTARRGQNLPATVPANLTTPGEERALVWVFDATDLGTSLGGTPSAILELFTDTPRALAVSPDGNTVYAAGFHTGNQTTTVTEGAVCDGGATAAACLVNGVTAPGGLPGPNTDANGVFQKETGLIVRFDGTHWVDPLGRAWDDFVKFNLPDKDVFAIDATATPPVQTGFVQHVGTVLFNMVANPVTGTLYVSNTDAQNHVRFEGPGTRSTTVRGHLAEARITVIDGGAARPRRLNKHINYSVIPASPTTRDASLATPLEMAVSADGQTLYVAAFGSDAIGVFATAELESDTFTPSAASHIAVSGGGPSGVVLDDTRHRLYVATRFDDGVSVIDTTLRAEVSHLAFHDPEPASVRDGRPVLYDARLSSSNGEAACASCHIFGDFDSLAWDLGNPDDVTAANPNPIEFNLGADTNFHPLKGPMTTQSLRGMANAGPMHWRGDRTGGSNPGGDPLDEAAAFKRFIVAFDGLLGRGGPIADADMQRFTDFILQVSYPPNPVRSLDNAPTPAEANGESFYLNVTSDSVRTCNGCHTLAPAQGFFGTDGDASFENEPQVFKIPHLRNAYQKIGMFGFPSVGGLLIGGEAAHQGDQVRGFGFLHDGSVDTVLHFLRAGVFSGFSSDTQRREVEAFVLAFPSNLAPIVGQQVTLTPTNAGVAGPRIDLLLQRAALNECDVVAKGVRAGWLRGAWRQPDGSFQPDSSTEGAFTDAVLRSVAAVPGQEITYTCVPPGSGLRVGIDRDEDGCADFDDPAPDDGTISCAGATTTSTTTTSTTTRPPTTTQPLPTTTTTLPLTPIPTSALTLRDRNAPTPDPARRAMSFAARTRTAPLQQRITPPLRGSFADPTRFGATLYVYNTAGLTLDTAVVSLGASLWRPLGTGPRDGFEFKVPAGTVFPVSRVRIRQDSIRITAGGASWPYSLEEPRQGSIGLRLVMPDGSGWCVNVPAKNGGRQSTDTIDRFVGAPHAPAPTSCPGLP